MQAAFDNLLPYVTTLVLAHRLATVASADRILLVDNGRIAATGTHEELIVESLLYRHLADLHSAIPDRYAAPAIERTGRNGLVLRYDLETHLPAWRQ